MLQNRRKNPNQNNKRKPQVQKQIKKKALKSNLTSTRRVAGPRSATQRQRVARAFTNRLPRRLPGSFPGFVTSEWSHNVENPFSDSGAKIPDLVSGPPSVLMTTKDITNTYAKVAWPSQVATSPFGPDGMNVATGGINTVGQQLIVQFLPCVMSPASFSLTHDEGKEYIEGLDPMARNSFNHILSRLLEGSADKVTPVLGYWMVLDANGKIISVDVLRADKLMTAEESIKMIRLTKAGIKVGLQQPKLMTGGQVYFNRGAGAFLPVFGRPDLDGNQVEGNTRLERISAFKPGSHCYVNLDAAGTPHGPNGFEGEMATKANMVRLCSKTAGTAMRSLDSYQGGALTMASYPLDSVKALEYSPYETATSHNISTFAQRHEAIVGTGTLGMTPGWPPGAGSDATGGSFVDIVGYNADRITTRWCPGWFVFHPTFSTSINPAQIVANLQIETYTAWEFIPYARTFAHLARTPAHVGDPSTRKVGKTRDSLTGSGGINDARPAPLKTKGGSKPR